MITSEMWRNCVKAYRRDEHEIVCLASHEVTMTLWTAVHPQYTCVASLIA